jgi:class 3 adenylate cyclase/tetratricopeptide (TPR) repeat protein
MDCPHCQAHNPETARFCQNCGMALAQTEAAQRCPKCQTSLPAGARFCINCGQSLSKRTPIDDARLARVVAAAPAPLVDKAHASAHLAGERRVVTALYVDVVNSTALAEHIGADHWNAIMNVALDRCYPAIYRYEGTIAHLLGDELLAFFGAPVAHEDDPLRAVHAALELLGELREYAQEIRQEHGIEFAVRTSLSTGPVVVGPVGSDLQYEYSALEGPINLAAQVESIKWPMKVLITGNTYRFVAPFFDCIDLGWIEAKGQTDRVHVYQVCRPKARPDQERGLAGLASPMVGRDSELTALRRLGEAMRAGLGRAVLIVGEPGLGKTRLIAEWKAADTTVPTALPVQWAAGHCHSYSRDLAYRLLLVLLRSLIGVPAAAGEPETRAALIALIQDLFGCTELTLGTGASERADGQPAWNEALDVYAFLGHLLSLRLDSSALERIQHLDPQALHAQYVAAVRRLLQAMSGRRPLVLILENLHWADPSSTELLIQLLPLVTATPLLLCLTTRPDHDAPGWKLVTATREALGKGLTEIALDTLSPSESQQLIANLLEPQSLPEQVLVLIHSKAEGNPLFVEEVIRMLIEQGMISQRGGRWVAEAEIDAVEIPDNLQGLLLARIDRLPKGARYSLRVASVIGRQFSVEVLESMVSEDERGMSLVSHLGILESAGLIQVAQVMPELAYRFRNALIQDAAYASILATDRERLHLAVAETLERLYPERLASRELAPTLAQHFSKAGGSHPLTNKRGLKYFALAGEAAMASYANQEAERHYRSALQLARTLPHSETEQADLVSRLGEALYRQGRFRDAIEIWHDGIDLYRALEDWDSVARLYARATRALWSGGDTPGSLRLCEEGLAAVADAPESPGLALLVHEAARAYLFNGLPHTARPYTQRAIEMAEQLGIAEVQVEALATLGLFSDQPLEAKLEALTSAIELAESSQLLNQAARAHTNLAAALLTATGDTRAALHHYRRAAELNHTSGNTASELLSLCGVADAALRLGSFAETEETFRAMRSLLNELANPGPAAVMFHITEAALLRYQGELEEAAQMARVLQADARQREDLYNLIEVDGLLADILLESRVLTGGARASQLSNSCAAEIEAALLEAIQMCERRGQSSTYPRCLLSEVRASEGRLQDARSLLGTAREEASLRPIVWEKVWLLWAEARVAATAERWAEALAAFEAAAGVCSQLGIRWWWARVLQEWAAAHASRGQPADLARARVLLRETLVMFEELGVPRYAALARETLQDVDAASYVEMLAHYEAAQELALAGRVQESLLPAEPPHIPGWQLAVALEPARETSGDFYDFISLPDGRWGIVIADVADKGAGAALYMALCRTLIRTYAVEHNSRPELLFNAVNGRILAETHSDIFVTVFFGVLDPAAGTLVYCNAGHSPPYLLRARTGAALATTAQALRRTGPPLGILEDAAWKQDAVRLAPGDTLVLYTDGVSDAHDPQGALFGRERLQEAAQPHLGRSASHIKEAILESVHQWVGSAPQFDDITLMIVVRG